MHRRSLACNCKFPIENLQFSIASSPKKEVPSPPQAGERGFTGRSVTLRRNHTMAITTGAPAQPSIAVWISDALIPRPTPTSLAPNSVASRRVAPADSAEREVPTQSMHVRASPRLLPAVEGSIPPQLQPNLVKVCQPSADAGVGCAFQGTKGTNRPPARARTRAADRDKRISRRFAADARNERGGKRAAGHPAAGRGSGTVQRHPPRGGHPANPKGASESPLKSC